MAFNDNSLSEVHESIDTTQKTAQLVKILPLKKLSLKKKWAINNALHHYRHRCARQS